jgi:chorismate synthase
MSNTFGKLWRITTYGESHGPAIGVVIDGCPAGLRVDLDMIQDEMDRRRPGQSSLSTARKETDKVVVESGLLDGVTTGTPIHMRLKNKDARSKDYSKLRNLYRPSHADYTYQKKYGIREYRGGGRASARETACRVAAGALAKQFIGQWGIEIRAFVQRIGGISMAQAMPGSVDYDQVDSNRLRVGDAKLVEKMEAAILEAQREGDSLGGIIYCHALHVPVGLGEPIYDKLPARLGAAMLGINAVKGFDLGSGFSAPGMRGSEHNDDFYMEQGQIKTRSNYSGGVQGGISNGMPIYFRVAFKPVASIAKKQTTVNQKGEQADIEVKGRHDPCVVPRAVPIVEAMTALVFADFILLQERQNAL